ncbi:MAG: hypothetical protein K9N40_01310 [Candidatus Cloacimonetes bacterium]|nr:hypothetical protein [Candidatus Cloacimonadota bacterium]
MKIKAIIRSIRMTYDRVPQDDFDDLILGFELDVLLNCPEELPRTMESFFVEFSWVRIKLS